MIQIYNLQSVLINLSALMSFSKKTHLAADNAIMFYIYALLQCRFVPFFLFIFILAEGAIVLSVTLSGDVLVAS